MKYILLFLLILSVGPLFAQNVYVIKADSVKITNCDSAELIIENHTQNVPGYLFNTGNGRTIFKRGASKINDSMYLVGADTIKVPKISSTAWVQGGNSWGTTGVIGTKDYNNFDFYTNGVPQARLNTAGCLLLGASNGNTNRLQVYGNTWNGTVGIPGGILVNPVLSRRGDIIRIGTYLNTGDGQNVLFSCSSDSGGHFRNVLVERDGYIGLGTAGNTVAGFVVGNPALRINANGNVSIASQYYYFGNQGGPANASSLMTYVSNVNEWQEGRGNYPNGQNYYYFGTTLGGADSGNARAPLKISARELHFMTSYADAEAGMFTAGGNFLLGSTTDNGYSKLQVTGNITATGSVGIGTSAPTAQLTTTGTVRFTGLTQDSTQTRVIVSDVNGNIYYRNISSFASSGLLNSSLADHQIINSSLAFNGDISARRIRVSAASLWPDYVFAENYELPRLREIEKYIQREHHLPGIPSAGEILNKGIDLGDNQAVLLQKIEELTLYIIQQDKSQLAQGAALKDQQVKAQSLEEQLKAQQQEIRLLKDQNKELQSLKMEMTQLRSLIKK